MTAYRQWFRIDNVQTPRPREPADGAFHSIVTVPHEPRTVEMLLADFFGQHGLIGIDHGDMVDATSGGEAPACGRVEVVCSLKDAENELEGFADHACPSPPKSMIMMLSKRKDGPGENMLVDVDRLAERLEPLGARLLYQCDLRPGRAESQVVLVAIPHEPPRSPSTEA